MDFYFIKRGIAWGLKLTVAYFVFVGLVRPGYEAWQVQQALVKIAKPLQGPSLMAAEKAAQEALAQELARIKPKSEIDPKALTAQRDDEGFVLALDYTAAYPLAKGLGLEIEFTLQSDRRRLWADTSGT